MTTRTELNLKHLDLLFYLLKFVSRENFLAYILMGLLGLKSIMFPYKSAKFTVFCCVSQ